MYDAAAAAAAKLLQSCLTLCDPIDSSPPGSPIPGILQARTMEWVAIFLSNAWKWSRSVVSDSATPWTAAYQALPSMGFSRQEYWSGVPLPSPCMMLFSCLKLFSAPLLPPKWILNVLAWLMRLTMIKTLLPTASFLVFSDFSHSPQAMPRNL